MPPIPAIPPFSPDWADPWGHPEYYQGVTARRIMAYGLDVLAIAFLIAAAWGLLAVAGLFTLGLAWLFFSLPGAAIPLCYHILSIAGPAAATPGMRMMGVRVRSLAMDPPGAHPGLPPGHPTLIQAVIQTVAFYGSVASTGFLILVLALFNARRRTLHDWLAGTVVVNVQWSEP